MQVKGSYSKTPKTQNTQNGYRKKSWYGDQKLKTIIQIQRENKRKEDKRKGIKRIWNADQKLNRTIQKCKEENGEEGYVFSNWKLYISSLWSKD